MLSFSSKDDETVAENVTAITKVVNFTNSKLLKVWYVVFYFIFFSSKRIVN